MAKRVFTETPYEYAGGFRGFAVGQTRGGVEELVSLSGNMVFDEAASLWLPVSASNPLPATLSGSFATLRPMTGGSMTVAGTAAEIAPGTTGRRGLWLRNEEDALRIRIDGAGITDQTGAPMEPGEVAILLFDPAVWVPVYVISEAGLARLDYNWW